MAEAVLHATPEVRQKTTPRVGFLGLGWIGRSRMQSALDEDVLQVAALADPSRDALDEARAVVPHAQVCDSIEALLEQPLDGVVIATPSAMHAAQTELAAGRGLPVFCQKPLGRTAIETAAAVEAARSADVLLGVDFSYRHMRGVRVMREIVSRGELGQVFAVRAVFHNAYGPGKSWFYEPASSGGGCVMDLGIHLLDLIPWTLGGARVDALSARLFSQGARLTDRQSQVEDYAVVQMDLSGSAVAEMACSWNLSTGCDAVIQLSIWGTAGALELKNVDGSYFDFVLDHHRGRVTERIADPPDAWGGRALCSWARQLRIDASFDAEVEDAVQVAELIDRVYGNGE